MMQPALEVNDLVKRFGDRCAVDQVNLRIQPGELVSLLGPNGAGKSTTINLVAGLLTPDSGSARICGADVVKQGIEARRSLGLVPQELALYDDLSAGENLRFWGKMVGLMGGALVDRVARVLELVGLTDRSKDRVKTFSGGMKRRLNIGVALLGQPALVIMDEPTVGIDPQSRRHILDGVKALPGEMKALDTDGLPTNAAVLYTTHYMEEAAELSDRIIIMDQGKVIAEGTHDQLITLVGEHDRVTLDLDREPAAELLTGWREVAGVSGLSASGTGAQVLCEDGNRALPRLVEAATECGARVNAVAIKAPNLEAVFLHLTGRSLRDE